MSDLISLLLDITTRESEKLSGVLKLILTMEKFFSASDNDDRVGNKIYRVISQIFYTLYSKYRALVPWRCQRKT